MSSQGNEATNSSYNKYTDRVVTDSVHSRFRPSGVRCDICKKYIIGNHSAIEKHFNNSHPSSELCCYCKGKVFTYTQMPIGNSTDKPKNIVYHKCSRSEVHNS